MKELGFKCDVVKLGMTVDNQGRPGDGPGLLTLTEAAARTGYSRDALRQRIRRGKLSASKGNDGQIRIHARDLGDLPPADLSVDTRDRQMTRPWT